MSRFVRLTAALVLALLLPVQALAAVCAQICAQTQQERHAQVPAPAQEHAQDSADRHCTETDTGMGAGKCCHAHTFLVDISSSTVAPAPATPVRTSFVARWASFIPEEPSPPPIAILPPA